MDIEIFISIVVRGLVKSSIINAEIRKKNWTSVEEFFNGEIKPRTLKEILIAEIFVMHLPLLHLLRENNKEDKLSAFFVALRNALKEEKYIESEENMHAFDKMLVSRYSEYVALAQKDGNYILWIAMALLTHIAVNETHLNSIIFANLSALAIVANKLIENGKHLVHPKLQGC